MKTGYITLKIDELEYTLNSVLDNDVYYVLTKRNSAKIKALKRSENISVILYDKRICYIKVQVDLITNVSEINELFKAMTERNHCYFDKNDGDLIGLRIEGINA